jgi:Cu(I)/Ag(I) efflux system membrane fusion protein
MNRNFRNILILLMSVTVLFMACKSKPKPPSSVTTAQSKAYYTCSMHPQVHEEKPGDCPICSMKLIKVELTNRDNKTAGNIILTATQLQLAGIKMDTVREENTGTGKTLSGTVTTDESHSEMISARIAGRIQRLFIRTTGEKITTGQPLYAIYSEDLQEAEKEYLLAKTPQKLLHNPDVDYRQLISAAENKLQLWGLSSPQIKALAASGRVSATTTVMSKINGTVSDISVHEGDYVTEGMPILKTQALNNLWVEAQLYSNETINYTENERVSVSFPDLNGQTISGKIEFINPELSDASKVDLIRVSIPNSEGLIHPGMQAYISLNNSKQLALAVPVAAVLTNEEGSRVWIKNTDGSFSPKAISIGTGNATYVPVLSGLNSGDIVVTSGAYLLNSEAIFKNGDSKSAMGSMKM